MYISTVLPLLTFLTTHLFLFAASNNPTLSPSRRRHTHVPPLYVRHIHSSSAFPLLLVFFSRVLCESFVWCGSVVCLFCGSIYISSLRVSTSFALLLSLSNGRVKNQNPINNNRKCESKRIVRLASVQTLCDCHFVVVPVFPLYGLLKKRIRPQCCRLLSSFLLPRSSFFFRVVIIINRRRRYCSACFASCSFCTRDAE